MKRPIFRFLPAIGWFLLSFYLLTIPGKELPAITWFDKIYGDKFVHIAMFGILVGLFLLPFRKQWSDAALLKKALLVSIVALVYGIAMEFVQKYFIPNRSFSIGDILADGVGSFIPFAWLSWRAKRKTAQ